MAVTITVCWKSIKSQTSADNIFCFPPHWVLLNFLMTSGCQKSYLLCHSSVTWCYLCRCSFSLGALEWLEKNCFSILGLVVIKQYYFCSALQKNGSPVSSRFWQSTLSTPTGLLMNETHPHLQSFVIRNLLSVSPDGIVYLCKSKSPGGNIQLSNIINIQSLAFGNRNWNKCKTNKTTHPSPKSWLTNPEWLLSLIEVSTCMWKAGLFLHIRCGYLL